MPTHYSWSGLTAYVSCGEKYRRRYVEKDHRPPGLSLVMGSAVHAAAEANLRNKILHGVLLDPEFLDKVADNALDEKFQEGVRITERDGDDARAKAQDTVRRLARLHHERLAPKLEPALVEHYWELPVPGKDWALRGVIDCIEVDGKIRDLKTHFGRGPVKDAADASDQLTMYALWKFANGEDGKIPPLTLDHVTEKKDPEILVQETTRTGIQLQSFIDRVVAWVEAIEARVYPPATRDSWGCSEAGCEYWADCKYTTGWRHKNELFA